MNHPNTPKILKGGIVTLDPATAAVQRIITLQYNPDTLSRTLQVQGTGGEGNDRSEALRLKGPPVETIKLDAELDDTDQLEFAENTAVEVGLHPQLALLELLVYPSSTQLQNTHTQAQAGTLEIAPMEAPLTVFVWSQHRVVPMRITEFSITEEAFDTNLNPIRAKISLGMRVLSVSDLGFNHKGGSVFMSYLQNKEQLVTRSRNGAFSTLGITGIP